MMKDYSALISVYDKENAPNLKQALDSIYEQSVLPTDVVLVEDGKLTNELNAVVAGAKSKFETKGIEFTVIKNKNNKGLGPCLNQGMDFCREELIARFDSDDINKQDRMKTLLNFYDSHRGVSVVGGFIAEFRNDENNTSGIRKVPTKYNDIIKFSKVRNPMNHMSVILKKRDVKSVGAYDDVPGFEDYYLWLKLINNKFILVNVPEVIVLVRVGNNFEQRRSGFNYLKKEFFFERKIYLEHMISFNRFIKNVFIRSIVRLLPQKWVRKVYDLIRN